MSKVAKRCNEDGNGIQTTNKKDKRAYDILNILRLSGFVDIETKLNARGKPSKQSRKYRISE